MFDPLAALYLKDANGAIYGRGDDDFFPNPRRATIVAANAYSSAGVAPLDHLDDIPEASECETQRSHI
jgi:hypothetical protein